MSGPVAEESMKERIRVIGVRESTLKRLQQFLREITLPPSATDFASAAIDKEIAEQKKGWTSDEANGV